MKYDVLTEYLALIQIRQSSYILDFMQPQLTNALACSYVYLI